MIVPWVVVLLITALAPLMTWLPFVAVWLPWSGLPVYPGPQGIDLWHSAAFALLGFALLACMTRGGFPPITHGDRWLAVAVLVVGLVVTYRGVRLNPTHAFFFAIGAAALTSVRMISAEKLRVVRGTLVGLGAFQALYIVHQWLGYDVLWGRWGAWGSYDPGLKAWQATGPTVQMIGTLGTVDAASAYVAILTPLFPVWLLPLGIAAVAVARSNGAYLALAVALVVAFRARPVFRWTILLGSLGVWALTLNLWHREACAAINAMPAWSTWDAVGGEICRQHDKLAQSIYGRAAIGAFALEAFWYTANPILGWGLGAFRAIVPFAQQARGYAAGTPELWQEAHNDALQWFCETGVVGLVLLTVWLWEHRPMFVRDPWAPCLAALAVVTVTFFPWHVVSVALVGIVLVGAASAFAHSESTTAGGYA